MRVFQVLPSIVRRTDGKLRIDVDFYEALRAYLDHFDRISIACPITVSDAPGTGLERCRLIEDVYVDRVRIIELPSAYSPMAFLRHFWQTRALLRSEIKRSDYVIASPHATIGDWPTVAVCEAMRLGKQYVVEADVVYESLARSAAANSSGWKRFLKERLITVFSMSYRRSLKHSKLALFQGKDVFAAYAPFCPNPQKVEHHVPIYRDDHITQQKLEEKFERVRSNAPLNICYAGRAIDMKGPFDWINTVYELVRRNVKIRATWLGDGPLLPLMKAKTSELGISDSISFPGYLTDRGSILSALQDSDIFLFCHRTQESARVLGEALACGCPIIGYQSRYPADIVSKHGGGLFASVDDWIRLAGYIQNLDEHREELCCLIQAAARSGQGFDRAKLLDERMLLIKKYLGHR